MEILKSINGLKIILGSKSPRRQDLLKQMGIDFTIDVRETDEVYPYGLTPEQIVLFLAKKKADQFLLNQLQDKTLIITADTIVWFENEVLGKPQDLDDAFIILKKLSGNMHQVFTGVHFKTKFKAHSFFVESKVYFKQLTDEEIHFYIKNFKPLDKAGAYGVQEWIGYIGIEKIEGSYFNVMGLPTQDLYRELMNFI